MKIKYVSDLGKKISWWPADFAIVYRLNSYTPYCAGRYSDPPHLLRLYSAYRGQGGGAKEVEKGAKEVKVGTREVEEGAREVEEGAKGVEEGAKRVEEVKKWKMCYIPELFL